MLRLFISAMMVLIAGPVLAQAAAPESRSCLTITQIKRSRIIDERVIMFQVNKRWYRNDLAQSCPGLDSTRSLVNHLQTGAQICSGDPFDVVDSAGGIPRASCIYGRFTLSEAPGKP